MVLGPIKQLRMYLLLLCLLAAGNVWGQRDGGGREAIDPERLQTARIAYITTRISLKPEQAEKFWPVFNAFTESRDASMRTMGDLSRGVENMTEEEAKSRIQQKLQIQQKLVQDEKITLLIQINGKVRDKIEVDADISEEEAKRLAISSEKVKNWVGEKENKKIVFVPKKLVNIVIN